MSLLDGAKSLQADINKFPEDMGHQEEGVVSALEDELELSMPDDELIDLKNKWEKAFETYNGKIVERQKENLRFWEGDHMPESAEENPLIDNLVFEAVETLLPIITRQNPEPVVYSDDTAEGQELADSVQKMLTYLADDLALRLKVKDAARHWLLSLLGVMKIGWNFIEDEIEIKPLRPQKLILDPNATIVKGKYTGDYIGELRTDSARLLVKRFPKKAKEIKELVDDKMATDINYTEWWSNEYVFWTMKNIVLGKAKNPHWNYEEKVTVTDEYGNESEELQRGTNHFRVPQMPYAFLSVFNTGLHPHDDTSLIEQVIGLQNMINKRQDQIDRNADHMNGGLITSGQYFTKEQAAEAGDTLRKGGVIIVPDGDINQAIKRDQVPALPSFIFDSLLDARDEIRNLFGIRGSTAQGIMSERTVRGKIEIKGQDQDRVSTITAYIEQFVDYILNWQVQMMHVYYTEPHVASVIGEDRGRQFVEIRAEDFNRKLLVSMKEGSMIPKDSLTRRNEAIDLWGAGAIDPQTLYERLEFPDPKDSVQRLVTWQTQPQALLQGGAAPEQQPELPPMTGLPL